ncbi:hypothetical protein [Kitasatospora cinereorecta]|uniref:Uncharacterized protein n=1 Tax=Kitasatospora cinereorecta TaxID=285560 RepID=A0ABW0VCG6_9ACTN
MAHPVLALGAAAVTLAGNVWYLPALVDLRAGDDRPRATRLAAVACLVWWMGAAAAGPLLLSPLPGWAAVAVVVAGGGGGGVLRCVAAGVGRREQVEQARRWEALALRV